MSLQDQQFERFIGYAAGELSPAESAAVEAELQADPVGAATVARFQQTVADMRADRSEAPPAETLVAAKALFRQRAAGPSLFERLKRVLADLVYDSRSQLALAGVRGADSAYQLSYECSGGEIDVQVEPDGAAAQTAQRRVIGQVTLRDAAKFEHVVLTVAGSEEPVATASIDVGGVFAFTTTTGTFDLWVASGDQVLVVPDVEIR